MTSLTLLLARKVIIIESLFSRRNINVDNLNHSLILELIIIESILSCRNICQR